jgi:hypothetical protein
MQNHKELKKILNGLKEEISTSHPRINAAKDSQASMNQQLKKYHAHISKCAKRMDGFHEYESVNVGFPSPNPDFDPYLKFCLDHLCHLGKRKTTDYFIEQGDSVDNFFIVWGL